MSSDFRWAEAGAQLIWTVGESEEYRDLVNNSGQFSCFALSYRRRENRSFQMGTTWSFATPSCPTPKANLDSATRYKLTRTALRRC